MRKANNEDKSDVLTHCFVALASFSENALGPAQRDWATERAENCLWALGIAEYKTARRLYKARQLVTETIDLQATKKIATES